MKKIAIVLIFGFTLALVSSFHEANGEINAGSNSLDVFLPLGMAEFQTKDCPTGLKAIGVGWQSLNPAETRLIDSKPFDETSWKLKFVTGASAGDGIRIHTVCAGDVEVQNLSKDVTISSSGLSEENTPSCPSGFKIVGAGWENLEKDKTQLHESKPVDQTTWSLGFLHDGTLDDITIYSVCVRPISVEIVTENLVINTVQDNNAVQTPLCPVGFKIVGAGWEGHDPDQTLMIESRPTTQSNWGLEFRFKNPGGDSFTVHSICIDLNPTSDFTVFPFAEEYVIAGDNFPGSEIFYLPSNMDGTFGSPSFITELELRLETSIGDFDNDKDFDFVAGTRQASCSLAEDCVSYYLFENLGGGNFSQTLIEKDIPGGAPSDDFPSSMAIADFNEDGFNDFASGVYRSDFVHLFTNNHDNTFTRSSLPPVPNPTEAEAGDFNEDGHMDFLINEYFASSVHLYEGDGTGSFTKKFLFTDTGPRAAALAVGDFNEDDHLDVIVDSHQGRTGTMYLGDGAGNFAQDSVVYVREFVADIDAFDFDKDTHVDLVVSDWQEGSPQGVYFRKGMGDGTFQPEILVASSLDGALIVSAPPIPDGLDNDGDGVINSEDNCPDVENPLQTDTDGDNIGDVCDEFPNDFDNDGISEEDDNCPTISNPQQNDIDRDGIGDVCDPVDDRTNILFNLVEQIQDILASILGLDNRVTELENEIVDLKEKMEELEAKIPGPPPEKDKPEK